MNIHENASAGATYRSGMVKVVSFATTAEAMRRYRAVVEGIVETRNKLAICESMKVDAERALADAAKSLSYNAGSLAEAEAELVAIEAQHLDLKA